MILDFAKDPNEYVSRRALLAMPALRPDCVEQFAPLFWERNCYSLELQEYQRIAVLVSLDAIHSACFHNTWNGPSRMAGAICWNTQNESKEDFP